LFLLNGHSGPINSALFSPDGKYIITTGSDHKTILWDAATGKPFYTRLQLEGNDWLVYDEHYRFDGTQGAIDQLYFVCGLEVVELNQVKDSLRVHNLVQRIMNGENLDHITKLSDLNICGVTPIVEPMQDMNLDVHIIAGNHDCFFKNTNGLNALREIIDGKYPFHIYDKYATEVVFDDVPILLIPWICDDNREITMRTVNETRSQIAFGHLELSGFEMYKGAGSSHGDDPINFRRFDILCSGHYHHRSSIGSIHYLGSPCEFTWSDYADPKGFHIFDTETRELTFIENPNTIFDKIFYDDSDKVIDDIMSFNPIPYKDKYLKVIIKNKGCYYIE
jgi:DNA repair exonuclease SbcCD nuclease subunit